MDKFSEKLIEWAEKMAGPAFEAAKSAARVEGMSWLAAGVLNLAIAIAIAFTFRWLWRNDEMESEGRFIAMVVLCLAGGFTAMFGLWSIIDPWTWAAMTNPELYLAKKALKL